jgi:hypothetical protein
MLATWSTRVSILVAAIMAVAAPGTLPGQVTTPRPDPASVVAPPAEWRSCSDICTHDDVTAFYRKLVADVREARIRRVGGSREGRPIHLVTLARPAISQPWEALTSGKPIILLAAQIHGDEPAGMEGLMRFAHEVAFGRLNRLLDDVILLLVPQINPDGGEAGTWGTRANRAGFNVNRDYMRLVNPEAQAMVEGVMVPWRPHVVVDLHELSGPRWYDFYALHPTSLHVPREAVDLSAGPATDAVRSAIEGAGFSYFPYHLQPSDPTRVPEEGILAAGYGPRQLRVYGGVQGAVTLLFESRREADARVGLAERVHWQFLALEGLVSWVAGNAQEVLEGVKAGREAMRQKGSHWEPTDSIVVRVRFEPRAAPVPYRMPEMEPREGGGFGRTGRVLDLVVPYVDRAVAVVSRIRPVGYALEPHRGDLARHLARHGLLVERLQEATEVRVESFRVDSVHVSPEPFEGYYPREVWTTTVPRTLTLPAGSWIVRANQPTAALAFHFLEPEDEDSFASYGELIQEERIGGHLPIHRLVELPGTPMLPEPSPGGAGLSSSTL